MMRQHPDSAAPPLRRHHHANAGGPLALSFHTLRCSPGPRLIEIAGWTSYGLSASYGRVRPQRASPAHVPGNDTIARIHDRLATAGQCSSSLLLGSVFLNDARSLA